MSDKKKVCFVVQGFGKKTDYTNGRSLDLNASYEVIKYAVTDAGLECIRADEIPHSGVIDVPMYQQLLEADLVVADLSTYNVNAAYELGVRHALRPSRTLVVAESKFTNPFDTNHITTLRYEHLGEDIGRREAKRFSDELSGLIKALFDQPEPKADSPVYTFLPTLHQPTLVAAGGASPAAAASAANAAPADVLGQSLRQMAEMAQTLLAGDQFAPAAAVLQSLLGLRPDDVTVRQQLALATYKAKLPTPREALLKAKELMGPLEPATTNDPETLGLWGAIHKRLWDIDQDRAALDEAVDSYERGYYLKQDHYNGINLAFLLDVRSDVERQAGQTDDAITDATLARRVRTKVIDYARNKLADIDAMVSANTEPTQAERYWVKASIWEAALGLGNDQLKAEAEREFAAMKVPGWMHETRESQGRKLTDLLARRAGP
jgi:tetratricopeptide (TPR) repeat protein